MTTTTERCNVGQLDAGDVIVDRCGERTLSSIGKVHAPEGWWIALLVFSDLSWSWVHADAEVERRVQP